MNTKELAERSAMIRDWVCASSGLSPLHPRMQYEIREEFVKWVQSQSLPASPHPVAEGMIVDEPPELPPGKTISPGVDKS